METSISYKQNATGYFQTKASCYFAVENYAPGEYGNPEVSPILAKELTGLPPAVIINAEFDPLRDDGILYAAKLRKAGGEGMGQVLCRSDTFVTRITTRC